MQNLVLQVANSKFVRNGNRFPKRNFCRCIKTWSFQRQPNKLIENILNVNQHLQRALYQCENISHAAKIGSIFILILSLLKQTIENSYNF